MSLEEFITTTSCVFCAGKDIGYICNKCGTTKKSNKQMKSQKQLIKDQLDEFGEVSRNFALRNYISRLAAIIAILKKEGMDFDTEERNGDYFYMIKKGQLKLIH